jgi:hypothetical protein
MNLILKEARCCRQPPDNPICPTHWNTILLDHFSNNSHIRILYIKSKEAREERERIDKTSPNRKPIRKHLPAS